ncbi:MAG: ATP synthase F1 subunit epsilon [Terricaulis sp.]
MTDKLSFALVSPERELFNGDVDHVVVPGSEGEFGVSPNHAPVMSVIKPGALRVINDGTERRIFVNGGFADVTPEGLTRRRTLHSVSSRAWKPSKRRWRANAFPRR